MRKIFWILLCTHFSFLFGVQKGGIDLVDIQEINPNIKVDLKYATKDNFTGKVMYPFNRCFLHREAAERLSKIQKRLEEKDLGLKIWDGFRPLSVQWKFWEMVPDERYVSDPRKGGRHTRGTAVDLTLVTLEGEELQMPSSFDDFTEKAHRNYLETSLEAIKNRKLLQKVMEEGGFVGLDTEWWHFDLEDWYEYPIIKDLDSFISE